MPFLSPYSHVRTSAAGGGAGGSLTPSVRGAAAAGRGAGGSRTLSATGSRPVSAISSAVRGAGLDTGEALPRIGSSSSVRQRSGSEASQVGAA